MPRGRWWWASTPRAWCASRGHGSKQMVYEVYGEYVEGLEQDAEAIRSYLGEDFR
ncbi:MAG: hypothetical protein Kow0092_26100 [Deferrisomatales bacterium]